MRHIGIIIFLISFFGISIEIIAQDQEIKGEAEQDTLAVAAEGLSSENFFPSEVREDWNYIPTDFAPEVLSKRLGDIGSTIELTYNDKVHSFINYFMVRNRDYTRMVIRRQELYFPMFKKYLAKYGLPESLKYLAIVESALNPRAVSRARAVGLWQFMSGTGKYLGLQKTAFLDERMSPEKSTEAACQYLSQLYDMFNDWHLALAAYNSGPGTVRKAIRRSGYKTKFWEIYNYLPSETRSYVPQFIAIAYAMNYAEEHNLVEPDREGEMPNDTIMLKQAVHLTKLADLTGSCLEDIQRLNPYFLRTVLPPSDIPWTVKLPIHAKYFLEKSRETILKDVHEMAVTELGKSPILYFSNDLDGSIQVIYRVKKGDILSKIALKNKLSVDKIRDWNNLSPDQTLQVGQRLSLWVKKSTKASQPYHRNIAGRVRPSFYRVQRGDTLWDIAKKYNMTVEQIKNLNHIRGHIVLRVGQRLKLS